MSNAGYSLGIDIGTTFTAVAICRSGRAEIAPLGVRGWSVPSAVFIGADNAILVGDSALRRSNTDPARVAREFKRRIGDPVPLMVGGSPMSADALTGMVLRSVIDQVLALEVGEPDHAVVTHPANWGPYKTDLLRQAIRMSGLDQRCPISLMTEPEAAAAHYAGNERLRTGESVAVYDLGGGTFDAAVLRTTEHGWEFLAPAEGVERLGGIDFDEAVFNHVDEMLGGAIRALDAFDPAAVGGAAQLRKDCVEAKEALSSDVSVSISVALPNIHTEVRLTRPEFESMIRPSVDISVDAMRRALRASQIDPSDLRAVLLVGGSSRIPLISQAVSEAFQVPIAADAHPKHSVALGAALTAYHRAHVAAAPTESIVPPADPAEHPSGSASLSRWFFGGRTGTQGSPAEGATELVPSAGRVAFVPTRGPDEPTVALRSAGGATPPGGTAPSAPATGDEEPPVPQIAGQLTTTVPRRRRKVSVPLAIGIVVALLIGGAVAIITTTSNNDSSSAQSGAPTVGTSGVETTAGQTSDSAASTSVEATSTLSSESETGSAGVVVAESADPVTDGGGGYVIFETQADGATPPSLATINLDGTEPRSLISSTAPQADGQPELSTVHKLLAYLHRPTGDDDSWDLRVASFDGTGGKKIAEGVGHYSRPSWSPDETQLVMPLPGEGGKPDLFLINVETGERTQLTKTVEPESDPDFSPLGDYIVFRRDVPPFGNAEIFRLTVANPSEVIQLTNHPGYDSDPRYSPDATKIMITREVTPGSNEDLVLIDPLLGDSAPIVELMPTPNTKQQDAVWSADGKLIIYVELVRGRGDVFVMDFDGTTASNPRNITNSPALDSVPDVGQF